MDFIQAMNQATPHKQRAGTKNNLRELLVAKARPVPSSNARFLDQGDDAAANDDAVNNDDGNAQGDDQYVNDDGLDLREYAFKYVGCQTVGTWSDNLAADEDATTVLAKSSFAVFRMCPADSCSTYNKYGCLYDYGEYMIELEDYLAIVSQYRYAQYAEYCATCEDCMTGGGGNNRRRLADDDAANDDAANDDAAAGDDAVNDDAAAEEYQCQYADACANYQDACVDYSDDEELFEDYFQCAQLQDDNGNVMYLGPHCMSDSASITIGLFQDEYCTEYVGNIADMEETTGLAFDESSLAFYSSESCVSCDASVSLKVIWRWL